MVTPPKPPMLERASRVEWHCDVCQGDSLFDIMETNRPSTDRMRCIGCAALSSFYLDEGVVARHFRAHGSTEWEPKPEVPSR
jgi:hypothetical protein